MKYLTLCLVLSMLFSLSLQSCYETQNPSAKVCKEVNITSDDAGEDGDDLGLTPDTCCYLTAKGVDGTCYAIKKDNISDYKNHFEKGDGETKLENVKIDCSGNSGKFLGLAISLFTLLLLA